MARTQISSSTALPALEPRIESAEAYLRRCVEARCKGSIAPFSVDLRSVEKCVSDEFGAFSVTEMDRLVAVQITPQYSEIAEVDLYPFFSVMNVRQRKAAADIVNRFCDATSLTFAPFGPDRAWQTAEVLRFHGSEDDWLEESHYEAADDLKIHPTLLTTAQAEEWRVANNMQGPNQVASQIGDEFLRRWRCKRTGAIPLRSLEGALERLVGLDQSIYNVFLSMEKRHIISRRLTHV